MKVDDETEQVKVNWNLNSVAWLISVQKKTNSATPLKSKNYVGRGKLWSLLVITRDHLTMLSYNGWWVNFSSSCYTLHNTVSTTQATCVLSTELNTQTNSINCTILEWVNTSAQSSAFSYTRYYTATALLNNLYTQFILIQTSNVMVHFTVNKSKSITVNKLFIYLFYLKN